MIKSICLVRLSALGDVLMLVPLVRTLQRYLPHASLTWIISKPAYDLVSGLEGVEFIVIAKPNNLLDYWRFKRQFAHRRFDVLLAAQANFRANLLYALIKAKRKIGYDALRAKDGHSWFVNETITPGCDHTLDGFLKFGEALGIKKRVIRWDLPIETNSMEWAHSWVSKSGGTPVVVLNPAASKQERSWSLANYLEVIKHLQSRWHATVILTGGPHEPDRAFAKAITETLPVINLVGQTTLQQLLALIKEADLVICPDTGPSHMASAVGTPVIALHAVTSARVSGPYCSPHLAIDYYPTAVQAILKKDLYTNIWGTHAHGQETMGLIPLDAVLAKIDEFFYKFFGGTQVIL